MEKIEYGVDRDDMRFLFKMLFDMGKICEWEYNKALSKISAMSIHKENELISIAKK